MFLRRVSILLITVVTVLTLCSCGKTGKTIIYTEKAPEAVGPYSQAVIHGDMIYCSGQIAIDPETNTLIDGDTVTQEQQIFSNINAVLTAAGSSFDNVLKVNVFLTDINDFSSVNEVYGEYFKEGSYPARSAVEVSNLPKGAKIEIEVIAFK